jgi:pimeloyl-ACP methyl ester carboxylesterase
MRYLYCHPLFDERKCSHRFSFQLKNTFESAGLTLERFDYRGTGEAEGEFADVSLESLRRDVESRAAGDRLCIVGLRFGASLAFDYCVRIGAQVKALVLLAPVIDGAEYVDHLYRKQRIKDVMTGQSLAALRDEGYDNLEGYKTGVKFIEQIKSLNLSQMAGDYALQNSVLIARISNRSGAEAIIAGFAESLKGSAKRVVVEDLVMPMFWERIPNADYGELTRKVLQFCCG